MDKKSQKEVEYSESHMCKVCKNFVLPNSCKKVLGEIKPLWWCKLWEKK